MADIVEQVKESNRIEDVIEESGFGLHRRHGRYLHGAGAEWSSLVVDTAKQVYHWNSHNERGDVISWVMARRNADFKTAVEELARRARLPDPKWSREDQAQRVAARAREAAFEIALRMMQGLLWKDAEALDYCRRRGWTDETIRDAGLGFTGRDPAETARELRGEFSLHEINLQHPDVVAVIGFQGDVQAWSQTWGVDLRGHHQEYWIEWKFVPGLIGKTRLIYPHFVLGRVRTFSGRNILGAELNKEGREVKSYNLPVALAGDRQPFYNHAYAPRVDELVIVEGQADAITLGQWGIPAMALMGTAHQDKPVLLEELKKRHTRLYWGLDGDKAGQKALIGSKRDWPMAGILGPMLRVVRWPDCDGPKGEKGKDANDWLKWGMGALGLTEYGTQSVQDSDGIGTGMAAAGVAQNEAPGGDSEAQEAIADKGGNADAQGAEESRKGAASSAIAQTTARDDLRDDRNQGDPLPGKEAGEESETESDEKGVAPGDAAIPTSEDETDELIDQAIMVVRQEGRVSISWLQRKLKIGYSRAARLMRIMAQMGVIGTAEVNGMRLLLDGNRQSSETIQARVKRLVAEQEKRARDLLKDSRTIVEEMAAWAGVQQGADRDEAIRTVFKAVVKMERVDRANYRGRLADLMQMGLRDFDSVMKAAGAEDQERPAVMARTLGGYYDGWLLEYVYDPAQQKARLAYRDPDRNMGVADFVEINGLRYVPKEINKFVADGGVLFASDLGPKKTTREVIAIIEAFINQHYLLETRYLGRIIAYYVLLTWVYDAMNALPYLRAMGEAGGGKSELMRRVGYLCYRMMAAGGASSAASFFRATETYRGTVFIDEADLADGGDMTNELVKFLNQGAMKGSPILKMVEVSTDEGREYEVATFATFCPKLIAMRKDFKDDAVGSRCITIRVMAREPIELKARGIKLYVDNEFRERARSIRNLLLRWRLENWEQEIPVTEDLMDLEISSRLNQVTMPLKALAIGDLEMQGEIERFMRIYNQEMVLSRSMTLAARVVEALWRIWSEPGARLKYLAEGADGEGYFVMIGDVAKVTNQIIDEMNANNEDDEEEDESTKKKRKRDQLTSRGVGSLIRNELQLRVGERRGKGYPVYWDSLKMQALAKRFGLKVFEGEPAAQQPPNGHQPEPPMPEDPPESFEIIQGGLL
jgi:DNA primase